MAILDSYNASMKVSVAEAKNKLPQLIKAVEQGTSVTICRRGKPVADIVRTSKGDEKEPQFGTLRGRIVINDPDWWKPMSDEEAEAFIDGR
jgi:prevent-host-death family protein